MATYKTAGRQRLLGFLESNPDRQFTVEELCEELDTLTAGENKTRKSTLYRHLSELCSEEPLFIRVLLIQAPKQEQTFWCLLTTVRLGCL